MTGQRPVVLMFATDASGRTLVQPDADAARGRSVRCPRSHTGRVAAEAVRSCPAGLLGEGVDPVGEGPVDPADGCWQAHSEPVSSASSRAGGSREPTVDDDSVIGLRVPADDGSQLVDDIRALDRCSHRRVQARPPGGGLAPAAVVFATKVSAGTLVHGS